MRILVLSDLHGSLKHLKAIEAEAERADLILISGDITHFGGRREAESVLNPLRSYGTPLFLVPGNCDTRSAVDYFDDLEINLHGSVRDFQGITLAGLGGALPGPLNTPFVFSEEEYSELLSVITDGLVGKDIVLFLSHQPPHGTALDKALGLRHVGCRTLRGWIEENRPFLCISGHIHEACGQDNLGLTLLANPGAFKSGAFALVELSGKEPDIRFLQAG